MTAKPVKVYLDQNIYGHMYESCNSWQKGEIAQAILEARQAGTAEVWAEITNVVVPEKAVSLQENRGGVGILGR